MDPIGEDKKQVCIRCTPHSLYTTFVVDYIDPLYTFSSDRRGWALPNALLVINLIRMCGDF